MNILRLSFFLFLMGLSACGPYKRGQVGQHMRNTPDSEVTGYERVDIDEESGEERARVYTISGDRQLYDEMSYELRNESPLFAQSIQKVQMKLVRNTDIPQKFSVKILMNKSYFGLESVDFEVSLKKQGGNFTGLAKQSQMLPKNYDSQFIANLSCKDELCERVKLFITEQNATRRAKAGMIYQHREAEVQVQRSQAEKVQISQSIESANRQLTTAKAEQNSVVVVSGPSYSEVKVYGNAGSEPTINITTELIDTTNSEADVQDLELQGAKPQDVKARLSGNDPTTGGLIIDLDDQSTNDGLRIIVNPRGKQTAQPVTEEPKVQGQFQILDDPNKAILIPPKNIDKNSDIIDVTEQLNSYSQNPEIVKRALMWGGKMRAQPACKVKGCRMPYPERIRKFVYNAKLTEDVITENLLKSDVSPETAYILLIESEFLTRDSHPIQVATTTSATGPWQLVNGTADWLVKYAKLPFTITDVAGKGKKDREVDTKDARTKLSSSTRIAGNYLQYLRGLFPHDIGLSYLAYYRGQGNVQKFMKRTCGAIGENSDQCKYKVTLNQIHQFNMTSHEHTDYALTAIALRYIGRNPEAFGMPLPAKGTPIPAALQEKL